MREFQIIALHQIKKLSEQFSKLDRSINKKNTAAMNLMSPIKKKKKLERSEEQQIHGY
jgi:hypothetical protein